ncbi:MAG: hypothetical protein ABH878_04015 [bacterium]
MKASVLFLAVFLSLCSTGNAFNYSDQSYGFRLGNLDAKAAALGEVLAALPGSPSAMVFNPALGVWCESDVAVGVGGSFSIQREARLRPTFDTFDEIIYYNEYVLNEPTYTHFYAASFLRIPQQLIPNFVVGLAYLPHFSQDYEYSEEVRGTYTSGGLSDQVLGYNTIETSGGSGAITLSAAAEPITGFSLGISLSVLQAKTESTVRTTYLDPAQPEISYGWRQDYADTPIEITFGIGYHWQQRLILGLAISPLLTKRALQVEDRNTGVVTTMDETQPSILTFSLAYFPVNPIRTMVVFETRAEFWSSYQRENYPELSLEDILVFALGVEHRVLPEIPLRIGFNYRPSPSDPDLASTMFTFGTGVNLLTIPSGQRTYRLQLDLAGQVGARSYYHPDLFPESLFDGTDYAGEDRVQERTLRAFSTLTFAF